MQRSLSLNIVPQKIDEEHHPAQLSCMVDVLVVLPTVRNLVFLSCLLGRFSKDLRLPHVRTLRQVLRHSFGHLSDELPLTRACNSQSQTVNRQTFLGVMKKSSFFSGLCCCCMSLWHCKQRQLHVSERSGTNACVI